MADTAVQFYSPESARTEHVQSDNVSRHPSPLPSSATSISSLSQIEPHQLEGLEAPPTKRRKLTPEERLQKAAEKELREKQRAEAKAKKAEEKQAQDEERRRKNEEREEKARLRDFEKQQREEQRRQKHEERDEKNRQKEQEKQQKLEAEERKQKAQSRLGMFFKANPATKKAEAIEIVAIDAVKEKDCIQSTGGIQESHSRDAGSSAETTSTSDYRKLFLPFEVPSNTTWVRGIGARNVGSAQRWDHERAMDAWFSPESMQMCSPLVNWKDLANGLPRGQKRKRHTPMAVADLAPQLLADADGPTPSTAQVNNSDMVQDALDTIPLKFLHFCEDVRPPFRGTYTKINGSQLSRVGRAPFSKLRPDTNYDWDSEAEWEEPEEGEDLNSEGDDEVESSDGGEMDDFLDDEGNVAPNRGRAMVKELEPVIDGLCWVHSDGKRSATITANVENWKGCEISLVTGRRPVAIDPYSVQYWVKEQQQRNTAVAANSTETPSKDNAQTPAKSALKQTAGNSIKAFVIGVKPDKLSTTDVASKQTVKRPEKTLDSDEMATFRGIVNGSKLKKKEVLEQLKAQLPKTALTLLRDTLSTHAARIGVREADKHWVLLPGAM